MYKAFNLKINDISSIDLLCYNETGERLYDNMKCKAESEIDSFFVNGVIDVERLQKKWFPSIATNVFISHSREDEVLAISLAGYLHETFGWTSFIDSCAWGYMGDLIEQLDNNKNFTGANELLTSNVHMILSMALTKMIDKTECLLFLNTPNSVREERLGDNITFSPWICHEIFIASVIRRRNPIRRVGLLESTLFPDKGKFWYQLPLDKFSSIDLSMLSEMRAEYDAKDFSPTDWLDVLYEQFDD